MITHSPPLDNNGVSLTHYDQLCTLLTDENYEDLIKALKTIHSERLKAGDTKLAGLLLAIIQISIACNETYEESRWHQQALARTKQRQNQLAQILYDMLETISVPTIPPVPVANVVMDQDPAVSFDTDVLESANHYRLWQRFQSLIDPLLNAQPKTNVPLSPATLTTLATLTVLMERNKGQPVLAAYCLGPFEVYLNDVRIDDLGSRKSGLILKYLLINREQRVAKEMLMDLFWPDIAAAAARNNLNVAIYGLRRAFRQEDTGFSHILFDNDCYFLNPDMRIWMDSEKFLEKVEQGEDLARRGYMAQAVELYRVACTLYRGALLEDSLYEDWLTSHRRTLQNTYLRILAHLSRYYLQKNDIAACITVCNQMIAVDSCHEEAHRWLMHCYNRQGHYHLALRQYMLCKELLERELDTVPSKETIMLYERIRARQI